GVLDIYDTVAGFELVLDKFERARPHHLGDLLERVGIGESLWHHEQRQARHLADAVEQQRKRLLELDGEPLVAVRLYLVEHRRDRLSLTIPRHPAPDPGDTVDAAHWRAVMKA